MSECECKSRSRQYFKAVPRVFSAVPGQQKVVWLGGRFEEREKKLCFQVIGLKSAFS